YKLEGPLGRIVKRVPRERLPAQLISPQGKLLWMVDAAAADLVSRAGEKRARKMPHRLGKTSCPTAWKAKLRSSRVAIKDLAAPLPCGWLLKAPISFSPTSRTGPAPKKS